MPNIFKTALETIDSDELSDKEIGQSLKKLFGKKFRGYQYFSPENMLAEVPLVFSDQYDKLREALVDAAIRDSYLIEFTPFHFHERATVHTTRALEKLEAIAGKYKLAQSGVVYHEQEDYEENKDGTFRELLQSYGREEDISLRLLLKSGKFTVWLGEEELEFRIDSSLVMNTSKREEILNKHELEKLRLIYGDIYMNHMSRQEIDVSNRLLDRIDRHLPVKSLK